MGLDMYLSKKTYVKNWDHMKPERMTQVTVIRDGKPIPHIKPERIEYVIEGMAYWRKANHIHKWFVDHCGGGERDQDVVEDLKLTIKQLEAILSEEGADERDYIYDSSY